MSLTTTMVQALLKALGGQYYAELSSSSDKATVANAADFFTEKQAFFTKIAADAAANTATAETAIFRAEREIRVKHIYYVPSAAVTAHGTNYATILIDSRDGAGGSATNRATFATDTLTDDDLTAFVPKLLTTTDFDMDANGVLTLEITKASSGVAIAAGVFIITYVNR